MSIWNKHPSLRQSTTQMIATGLVLPGGVSILGVLRSIADYLATWDEQELTGTVAGADNVKVDLGRNQAPQTYAAYTPLGAEWTNPSAEIAHCDGTQAGETELKRTILLNIGQSDQYTFNISNYVSGDAWVRAGATDGTHRSADGTFVQTITATGETFRIKGSSGFVGDINLELVQVKQTDILASSAGLGLWDGTHSGVAVGQTGQYNIPIMAEYDGIASYTDIYSAELNSAMNFETGTIIIAARVANAGVWTDGTTRAAVRFQVDANNQIDLRRNPTNNSLGYNYRAGGVDSTINSVVSPTTDLFTMALTWDTTANGGLGEVKAYLNSTQVEATETNLGVWVGNLNPDQTMIGAVSNTPTNVWHGGLAYDPIIYTRALTQPELQLIDNILGIPS